MLIMLTLPECESSTDMYSSYMCCVSLPGRHNILSLDCTCYGHIIRVVICDNDASRCMMKWK